jgi:hypothetical protein
MTKRTIDREGLGLVDRLLRLLSNSICRSKEEFDRYLNSKSRTNPNPSAKVEGSGIYHSIRHLRGEVQLNNLIDQSHSF